MVVQGYLELFELKKLDNDTESMEQIMNAVSGQLGVLQEIQENLKDAVKPDKLKKVGNETGEEK
jgi:hypothetical protein